MSNKCILNTTSYIARDAEIVYISENNAITFFAQFNIKYHIYIVKIYLKREISCLERGRLGRRNACKISNKNHPPAN
jgi:hypothetical protein